MSSILFEEYCSELLSAKNLHIHNILTATSLTFIQNKRGPNTDPWSTPAAILIYLTKDLYA